MRKVSLRTDLIEPIHRLQNNKTNIREEIYTCLNTALRNITYLVSKLKPLTYCLSIVVL